MRIQGPGELDGASSEDVCATVRPLKHQRVRGSARVVGSSRVLQLHHVVDCALRQPAQPLRSLAVVQVFVPLVPQLAPQHGRLARLQGGHVCVPPEAVLAHHERNHQGVVSLGTDGVCGACQAIFRVCTKGVDWACVAERPSPLAQIGVELHS